MVKAARKADCKIAFLVEFIAEWIMVLIVALKSTL